MNTPHILHLVPFDYVLVYIIYWIDDVVGELDLITLNGFLIPSSGLGFHNKKLVVGVQTLTKQNGVDVNEGRDDSFEFKKH